MNDHHPSASLLLREAVDDLPVDVERLVRGGVSRGRTIRRRRRVGASLAAVAVVGVIGVAASVGPGLVGDSSRAIDPAGPAAVTTTPSAPATTDVPAPPAPRTLAVTQAEIPALFATIVPGDVSELPQSDVNDDAPVAEFLWEGTSVTVGVTPEDYAGPEYAGTPQERCAIARDGNPGAGDCRLLADGTAVLTASSTGPEVDGGITTDSAQAFTPDGWDVLAMASNAADTKDSPVLDDVPLVSLEQLLEVATSDVWFSGS